MISFGIQYWFIFLLSALAAAFGVALLTYYRNKDNLELSKNRVRLLMTLRFISFFIIAFFLLSPFIKNLKKITKNPVIITAWDNSSSVISTPDSANIKTEIIKIRQQLKDQLSSEYNVIEYSFGEQVKLLEELDFTDKKTDYSEAISSVLYNHFNENIGALVLIGDGINNQGKNPVNLLDEINFPVYAVGFGDTTEVADSRVQEIRVNRTSFSGNKFPVEIDAWFTKLNGKPIKLSVLQDKTELASVVITPPNQNYFVTQTFVLDAGTAGLKHYTVKTEITENERNTKNNSAGFVINVLEQKQKILILSDGPHPDIGAIKNTLDLQSTYDVSVFTEEPYPANLSDFNLLILNQLPTSGNSASEILQNAQKSRIPVLFIVGNKTFLPQLNALSQGATVSPLAGSGEEAQASLNKNYAIFNLSDDLKEVISRFPPLQVSFANYELQAGFTPLFYQRIMNIETEKPLLATGTLNGRKTGFIFGEGIWKWRLYNYYTNQNFDIFNEFINQLIQYLALRQNEDNFMIEFRPVYAETDDIIMRAEVYNDAFERISSEEVKIKIRNQANEELDFTFDMQGTNYFLNAGHLPMGDYTFSAEVKIGEKTYSETGEFTISAVNFESLDLRADYNLLYQLSSSSGGKFYLPAESTQLIEEIKNNSQLKPTSYFQEMVNEMINLKWLFFVTLLLLSVEWFLRKFWGIY